MDDKHLDKEIQASLLENSDSTKRSKEEIWERIEGKLALTEEETVRTEEGGFMNLEPKAARRKQGIKGKKLVSGVVAAAVLFAIVTVTTDTGQAFVSNIREFFAPEKKVVEEIEGMPEEKEVVLQEGKAGYIIYIDEERYALVEEDGFDKIIFNQELDERYPEVSMTITQIDDQTPVQLAEQFYQNLQASYATVKEITDVTDPVVGLVVSAIDGNEWNSPVTNVYVVANGKASSFVIQQNYFLEAAEGHGARFHNMLKEFKIVEKE